MIFRDCRVTLPEQEQLGGYPIDQVPLAVHVPRTQKKLSQSGPLQVCHACDTLASSQGSGTLVQRRGKIEEIPCRDVHLARCLQFAMHKFRLSLFVKDLEPGGSTTFCFLIV